MSAHSSWTAEPGEHGVAVGGEQGEEIGEGVWGGPHTDTPPARAGSPGRPDWRRPWIAGAVLAGVLALAYLAAAPPSADLAAATYRAGLFSRYGFTIWDTGWYGGHSLPAYSLLAPALGALAGVRLLLALSALAAAAMFGLLAARSFARRDAALAATLSFAFGLCAELPSGRVPYDLGVPIGLAALLALARSLQSPPAAGSGPGAGFPRSRRRALCALALALTACTSAASPVAGAFVALAGASLCAAALWRAPVPGGVAGRLHFSPADRARAAGGGALCAAALVPIVLLALAFPEGGTEPFAGGAFWPELAGAVAIAALLPRGSLSERAWRSVRLGACLYALALVLSFAIPSPVGGNVVRLGALFGAPLVLGCLWRAGPIALGRRSMRWWAVALALAPALLYWQLATAIDDQLALHGERTVNAGYYAPLSAELARLAAGSPIRVEVPMTGGHWESAYLPSAPPGAQISLARGWERQLDTRDAALFYGDRLTAAAYHSWLLQNAVAYVALPDARLDGAGRGEAALVRDGLPFLREVWRARHWRLFAVLHAAALAQAPARLADLTSDSFAIELPRAGRYTVALRFTAYWAILSGRGCVGEAGGGFTYVSAPAPASLKVGIAFSPARMFDHSPRCT
ncbi:MAG: hypothetical protein ACYDA6_01200 [Solirubrobacteraceae bacterium]